MKRDKSGRFIKSKSKGGGKSVKVWNKQKLILTKRINKFQKQWGKLDTSQLDKVESSLRNLEKAELALKKHLLKKNRPR